MKFNKNNVFIKEFTKENSSFKNLPHGPILIDDFIGNYIAISVEGSIIRLETYLIEGKPIKKSTHCGLTKEEMEVPVIVLNQK